MAGNPLRAGLLVAACLLMASSAWAERTYSVKIDSDPEGAKIYIEDPDSEPIGETPYTGDLPAGNHTLVIEAPGYETAIESIRVKKSRRRQSFSFELVKKPTAYLKLEPPTGEDFEDSTILIDEVETEVEPNVKFEVAAGAHKIEVVREGFETFEQYVEVEEGELRGISVNFVPEGAKPAGGGGGEVKKKKKKKGSSGPTAPATVPMFTAYGGVEWGGRDFKYDAASVNLRDYTFLGGRFRVGAIVHPLVSQGKWLGGVGISADVGLLLGPRTSTNDAGTPGDTSDDLNADNSWTDYNIDLRYRLDFAKVYWAAAAVGYGVNAFTFANVDAGLEGDLAEAEYKFLRFGALGGARFDKIDVFLGLNLYQVRSAGAVQERFDSSAITAFGLQLGGMMPISGKIDITARLIYDRFGYTFGDPPAGETYDASSAVDQLFGLTFGVGYRM